MTSDGCDCSTLGSVQVTVDKNILGNQHYDVPLRKSKVDEVLRISMTALRAVSLPRASHVLRGNRGGLWVRGLATLSEEVGSNFGAQFGQMIEHHGEVAKENGTLRLPC